MKEKWRAAVTACMLIAFCGCGSGQSEIPLKNSGDIVSTVFLSVTSDAGDNPQAVDMAMKFAGFSLDEGRRVVMFFNVKGVTVPGTALSEDFAWQDNQPIRTQLAALIKRGVDVHVCPICMKALGVEEKDLMEGAKVTTRPSLFANINTGTVVFTY
ncbi:MAG: DsrE family protein [Planctomycetaceae bacterium]